MRSIRVASVQFQHTPGDKAANLRSVERFVERAADRGVELIVFPEMCVTGYWHVRTLDRPAIESLAEAVPDGPTTARLLRRSSDTGMCIGAGLIERGHGGSLHNSYVLAMPDGRTACHRKLHTFISPHMTCGDRFTVIDTPQGCRVGILTCYDNNIIENPRITALMGAEILLAPHQTGGCDSRSPHGMKTIDPKLWRDRRENPEEIRAECRGPKGRGWLMRWLPARAHDNGMFLIFSNGVGIDDDEVRTGNAMILDPYGRIIAESESVEDDMVIAELDAALLDMSTGSRWMRARRPELYSPIAQRTGREVDTSTARFTDRFEDAT